MDVKVILLLCITLGFASCQSTGPIALAKRRCITLCVSLGARFKNKEVFSSQAAKREMQVICNEDSDESRAWCGHFKGYATRIAIFSESSPTRKICKAFCSKSPDQILNTTSTAKPESDKSRCDRCKSKVNIASNIARVLHVALDRVIDIVCYSLQMPNLKARIMCKRITNHAALAFNSTKQVEDRICTALSFCKSAATSRDQCAITQTSRRSNVFETAFKIVNIVSQFVRPHVTHYAPQLDQSFDVMDETAKCLSARPLFSVRSARRSRKASLCRKLCANVLYEVRIKLGSRRMDDVSLLRRNFKDFCNTFEKGTTYGQCHVIHKATDRREVLETIFRKQTCEQLNCDLYDMYPRWQCNLCKFNVMQEPIKRAVTTSLETIAEIENKINMLCKLKKDLRCEGLLAEQRHFQRSLKKLLKKNGVCNLMGLCRA